MNYEFVAYQMDVENHVFWVAKSKALNGCLGQGDTLAEAIAELESNEVEWLSTYHGCGRHYRRHNSSQRRYKTIDTLFKTLSFSMKYVFLLSSPITDFSGPHRYQG